MMEGQGTFNDETYDNMLACFDMFDPGLLIAQDSEWQGMMDYAASEGQPGDPWLRCEDLDEDVGLSSYFFSKSVTFYIPLDLVV